MFNKNSLKIIFTIFLMTIVFFLILVYYWFPFTFSKAFINDYRFNLFSFPYSQYENYWNERIFFYFWPFFILIPFFYCCISFFFSILEKKIFFIENIFVFCIYYFIAYLVIGYLITLIEELLPINISNREEGLFLNGIPALFIYNLLLFTSKKYRTFAKVSFVYLNYFLLYPTIILGLINFFPSLFNLLFVNDFLGDKIFELASPYKSFVIISALFTIFFQLYLWWGHDKLASFFKNKKVKKQNLKISEQ